MSALQPVAGYPVHAVTEYARAANAHGAMFTDWKARCGKSGTESGHGAFGLAGSARVRELCPDCFPQGPRTPDVKPIDASGGVAR